MRTLLAVLLLVACGHKSGGGGDDDGVDAAGTPTDPVVFPCPNCPPFPPIGPGSPPPCAGATANPQLVYPPDKVLLPPNMNVIDVHFMPGDGNTIFEIDFENASTDVRIETMCNAVTNTRGSATGGCAFQLDQNEWNYVSNLNRGNDPVTVTVRAAPADLACVSGSNSREISYASEDMAGGIYYWQSVTQGGIAGTTGGIFRKNFGDASPQSEPFLTPGTQNKCVGCHFLSRDGLRMTFGSDDADSDDEYGDLKVSLYDIDARKTILGNLPAGFQTFTTNHSVFLASDGTGKSTMPTLEIHNGDSGAKIIAPTFGLPAGSRVANPDMNREGNAVFFTVPGTVITGLTGYNRKDDLHFTNGSIFTASFDGTANTFGTASALVTAANADENNYYPAISPDGSSLVWNRAVGTTLAEHDAYNNPNASLFAMTVPGGAQIELANANVKVGLTNSWPRWSPFVQNYKGKHILWVTFSSTRDYGLIVQNENPPTGPTFNCYPPVSPEDPSGDHAKPFDPNCTQPQIWMAAVVLEDLAAGVDPSFPAFWLPFQDFTAHNHIAQWVETVTPPDTDCQQQGQTCNAQMMCCNGSSCNATTGLCEGIIL